MKFFTNKFAVLFTRRRSGFVARKAQRSCAGRMRPWDTRGALRRNTYKMELDGHYGGARVVAGVGAWCLRWKGR